MQARERVQIGTATIEAKDVRKGYEVAAWYTLVRVEAQEVPVFGEVEIEAHRGDAITVRDNSIGYEAEGSIVDEYFPALYGGLPMTDGKRTENLGKRDVVHAHPYGHAVALAILKGEKTNVTLADGWEALFIGYGEPGDEGAFRVGFTAGIYFEPSKALRDESRGIAAGLAEHGCVEEGATVEFRRGYARAKAYLAKKLADDARRAADSAAYVWRAAEAQAEREAVAVA